MSTVSLPRAGAASRQRAVAIVPGHPSRSSGPPLDRSVDAEELDDDTRFDGDATLLAAFFVAGYTTVLVETTGRRLSTGASPDDLAGDHRARLDRLYDALRGGVAPSA